MRKLLVLTRLDLINTFIERSDIFLYTLSSSVAPLTLMLVWLSFTPAGSTSVYSRDQIVWYFIFAMIVKLVTSVWGGYYLSLRIRRGAISPYLIQPIPYVFHYLSNNIAEKFLKIIILIPILGLILFFIRPESFQLNIFNLLLSVFSTLIAAAIFFLIDISVGLLSFWFDETSAINDAVNLLAALFSGILVPLIALPQSVRYISYILPFRYTLSLPIEIALGQLDFKYLILNLAMQFFWLIVIGLLCKLLWTRGLKAYTASGA